MGCCGGKEEKGGGKGKKELSDIDRKVRRGATSIFPAHLGNSDMARPRVPLVQRGGGGSFDEENRAGNNNTGKARRAQNAKHADFKVGQKGKQANRKEAEFGKEFENEMFEAEDQIAAAADVRQMGKRSEADKKATGWGGHSEFDREVYRRDRAAGRR